MKGNALLHYIKYVLTIDQPNTQTTDLERSSIQKYAQNALNAVEIGVFEGVNTLNIAANLKPNGKLYAIDPFWKGRFGICYGKKISSSLLQKNNVLEKVVFIEKLSYDATNDVPEFVDFIFIDGDHSYEGIKRDWEDWSIKISKGGVIALHDTNVPKHDPTVANLGSFKFYNDVITKDSRFTVLETVDSLNILTRQ